MTKMMRIIQFKKFKEEEEKKERQGEREREREREREEWGVDAVHERQKEKRESASSCLGFHFSPTLRKKPPPLLKWLTHGDGEHMHDLARFHRALQGAPPRGRQLYFTFQVIQTLYSKHQKHPF